MKKPAAPVPQHQLVVFRLGTTEFGLDVFRVHEVLRYQPVTPVPRAPAFVAGVIDLRGALLPVIDLRRHLQLTDSAADAETRILVVDHEGERLGLVVDAVVEVLRVPETALAAPPAYVRGAAAECLQGVARLPQRLIVVLDVERLLSAQERVALADIEALLREMRAAEAAPGGGPGAVAEPEQPEEPRG